MSTVLLRHPQGCHQRRASPVPGGHGCLTLMSTGSCACCAERRVPAGRVKAAELAAATCKEAPRHFHGCILATGWGQREEEVSAPLCSQPGSRVLMSLLCSVRQRQRAPRWAGGLRNAELRQPAPRCGPAPGAVPAQEVFSAGFMFEAGSPLQPRLGWS